MFGGVHSEPTAPTPGCVEAPDGEPQRLLEGWRPDDAECADTCGGAGRRRSPPIADAGPPGRAPPPRAGVVRFRSLRLFRRRHRPPVLPELGCHGAAAPGL